MKKRITALLLCLVMVLSLIPTTVWADTCTAKIKFKVIPVYVDSSKNLGYDVDYASAWEGTLPCTYTSKHSSNANHSIEIKGFHPSKMGWTVRDGYKWIGWDKTTTSTPQFSTYYDWSSSSASFSGTGTHFVYMVYGPTTPTTPTTPTIPEPVAKDIPNFVTVEDKTNIHVALSYAVADADLAAAEKINDKLWSVTINAGNYVSSFNKTYSTEHTLLADSNATQTVTLTYNTTTKHWSPSPTTVTFTVACKAEEQPVKPTDEEIKKALEGKTFLITDTTTLHSDSFPVIKESDLNDPNFFYAATEKELKDRYSINNNPYIDNTGKMTYVLRVDGSAKLQSYIKDYNTVKENVEHKYIYHDYTFLKKGDDGKWFMSSSYIATIDVKCETAPVAPTEDALLKIPGAVRVYCKDVVNDHSFYTPLKKGTFTTDNFEVKKIGGVYTYTVTLKDGAEGADPYLKESSSYHTEIVGERKSDVTFTWKNNEWKIANVKTDAAVITVKCHMPTDEELTELLKGLVTVDCSLIENHGPHTYDTDVTTLKPLTIQKDDETDTIFCTVELNKAKLDTYVEQYNAEEEFFNSAPHKVDADTAGTDLTVKLVWNANKWTVDEGDTFKIITKCKKAPAIPTADELKNLENAVLVQCRGMNAHDPDALSYQLIDGTYVTEWKDPETGKIETADVYWEDGAWRYNLFVKSLADHGVDGFIPYIEKFNETTGRYHDEYNIYSGFVQLTCDEDGVWTVKDPATVFVTCPPVAPTVNELNALELTVSVSCKNKPTAHRTHSFELADGYFSTELFLGEDGEYYCRVTLTKADAKHYVSQFDEITSKSHKVSKVEGEILLKWVDNTPSASALALNDGNEEEYTYWALADEDGNTTLNVTATCRKSGGGSTDTKDDGSKKVESGKTFDAGIAMYVGLGILSVTGSAMVIRKKKEF